jgi:hypothetical protein
VRRLLRGHPGETGIVLHRWSITRFVPWPAVGGWEAVTVTVARPEERSRAGDLRSGPPTWIGLDPGQHTVHFHGAAVPLRPQTIRLGPGDRFLIAFRAPIWLPFRPPVPARWDLRLLPDEPT